MKIITRILSALFITSCSFAMHQNHDLESYHDFESYNDDYEYTILDETIELQNRTRTETLIRALITNDFCIKQRNGKVMIRVAGPTHRAHYFTLHQTHAITEEICTLAHAKQEEDETLATRILLKSSIFPAFARFYKKNADKKHGSLIAWLQFAMHDEQRLFSLSSVLGKMLIESPNEYADYFKLLQYGLALNNHKLLNTAKDIYPKKQLPVPTQKDLELSQKYIIAAIKRELLKLVPRKESSHVPCCILL